MLSSVHTQSVIALGGAVFDLAADGSGTLWLSTESGLWRGQGGSWQPLDKLTPLPRTTALVAVDGTPLLLAGGAPGGIAYSADKGHTWHNANVDEIDSPITCFVASPRFAEDRVLLAGTAGSGILRSTDGGRYWRLVNAGLQEFTVLALATAPEWNEREVAFALTTGGIYRSPNGGRYWKRVAGAGDDMPLQALAVSPAFAEDSTVYAGGEVGIISSTNGGRAWQPVVPGSSLAPSGINCLWTHPANPRLILAGTLDGMIYRSTDGGSIWSCVATGYSSVLTFGASGSMLYAGLYDEGLLTSTDRGETWCLDAHLAVRDISRLISSPSGEVLAFGPTGGVWRACGATWQRLPIHADAPPLTALLSLPDGRILAGTTDGLLALSRDGELSVCSVPSSAPITALAQCEAPEVWLGNAEGEVWRSVDGGQQWTKLATLAGGQPLAALAAANDQTERTLAAATADLSADRVTLWRSSDGGTTWQPWFQQATTSMRTNLCLGQPSWASIGKQVWRWSQGTWHPFDLDQCPVIALRRLEDSPGLVAATTTGVYRRMDGAQWEQVNLALPPGGLLDVIVTPSGQIIGLGRGGTLRLM